LSNVKLDHAEISVQATDGLIATGLTKFGAIIGDRTEIGCNAVLNPGSVVGRDCLIYPSTNFRGVLPANSIVKTRQTTQVLSRRMPQEP
jgi:UDP-N-acetylglucosamine diphosphorylase / glucose-1-phosphate thymidylyltransferase / UDP-N-acetylgalactosamine diphosphorylase / glucosamine-1-phosphate N-acetyltransferase / galactosamine-1-phosphate N-acetyltransferase